MFERPTTTALRAGERQAAPPRSASSRRTACRRRSAARPSAGGRGSRGGCRRRPCADRRRTARGARRCRRGSGSWIRMPSTRRIGVQLRDQRQQLAGRRRGRQPVIEGRMPACAQAVGLVAHVDLRRGIVADQHHRQARRRSPAAARRRPRASARRGRARPAPFRPEPSRASRARYSTTRRTISGARVRLAAAWRPAGTDVAHEAPRAIAAARPLLNAARMSLARAIQAAVIAAARSSLAARGAGARPTRRPTASPRSSAGANTLFALRVERVVAFDGAGREIARCPRFEAPPPERPAAPAADGRSTPRRRCGWPGCPTTIRTRAEAEDVLDDEGLHAEAARATARPTTAIIAHALAASAGGRRRLDRDVGGRLSRARPAAARASRCRAATRSRSRRRPARSRSATEQSALALRRRRRVPGRGGLAARPRALAVVDERAHAGRDDDGVLEVGPYGVDAHRARSRRRRARGVRRRGARVRRRRRLDLDAATRRPGARATGRSRVRCRAATGAARASSRPASASTRRPTAPPGASCARGRGARVAAAATVAGRIWLAVDDAVLPARRHAPRPRCRRRRPSRARRRCPGSPPLATARLTTPLFPWPQLTVVFAGAAHAAARRLVASSCSSAFRSGAQQFPRADRRQLAAELVRRDAALAAQELELAAPAGDDPSRTARLRALRQEREALR